MIECRAGVTDIDVFGELNNARQLVFFELGRWALSQQVGFMPLMRKKKWGFVVGGASVRYRRRVPFLSRFSVTSKILCHDGRWFYFIQEIYRNGEICTSALMKAGVTGKGGLVPATEVAIEMGFEGWNPEIPQWVQAWIDAEGKRPWPNS
ncbi:MAG: acyl-CoA thioesterase [Pseudomonadota bacterium]